MILEGLCTTRNLDGSVNVAPMGPIVNAELTTFHFRPYQTSTTYQNLKRTGQGVFHVTDDVELIAQAAIGQLHETPQFLKTDIVEGAVLASACRWYEFRVTRIDDSLLRTEIETELVHVGRLRDFFGFNRAKHAVLEAAILATRLRLIPLDEIKSRFYELEIAVEKTAGPVERRTYAMLKQYLQEQESSMSR